MSKCDSFLCVVFHPFRSQEKLQKCLRAIRNRTHLGISPKLPRENDQVPCLACEYLLCPQGLDFVSHPPSCLPPDLGTSSEQPTPSHSLEPLVLPFVVLVWSGVEP